MNKKQQERHFDKLWNGHSIAVLANWFLNEKFVLKRLKIKVKLEKYSDWQVLKKFSWGTLAYDHEEGLKFQIPVNTKKLKMAVKFVREFHKKHKIPFRDNGHYILEASLNALGKGIPKHKAMFKNAGFIQSKKYDFNWYLKK